MHIKNKLFLIIILSSIFITSSEAGNEDIKLLLQQNAFSKALILAEDRLTKNSDEIQTLFLKGLILAKMNRLEESASIFITLTKEHPELPEPYNNLAVVYAESGDYNKAEEALRNAINTHPSYATAHKNLGKIYAKIASQAYNDALKLNSNTQGVKKNLSMIGSLKSMPKPRLLTQNSLKPELTNNKKGIKPELVLEKLEPESTIILKSPFDKEATRIKIKSAVDRWKNSWSSKDVNNYIKSYSEKFIPPDNLSYSKWREQRRTRLNMPKYIKISLDNMKIDILSEDMVSVKFLQIYQSDKYKDQVKKQLILNKIDKIWLISKEKSS